MVKAKEKYEILLYLLQRFFYIQKERFVQLIGWDLGKYYN